MTLPSHLFLSSDGTLFDTRVPDWWAFPLRRKYSYTHREINTVAELKATLRAGAYAWPGGYPMYFFTSDGAALSFEAVQAEFYQCAYSIRHGINDGWRVVGCEINYENADLVCDHTGKRIEAAYTEIEEDGE